MLCNIRDGGWDGKHKLFFEHFCFEVKYLYVVTKHCTIRVSLFACFWNWPVWGDWKLVTEKMLRFKQTFPQRQLASFPLKDVCSLFFVNPVGLALLCWLVIIKDWKSKFIAAFSFILMWIGCWAIYLRAFSLTLPDLAKTAKTPDLPLFA